MSKSSPRDELLNGGFASTGHSLLRMAGGWGNIGGPGIFMVRVITSGTLTALFTGMTGSIISALIYETASLPFLFCSCAGFVVGAFGFYYDAVKKSLLYLDRYPKLMQLHLDANFPTRRFDLWKLERLRSSNFGSWTLKSMLIVSWLSAMPAIENIIDRDEQEAVDSARPIPAMDESLSSI